MKVILLNTLVSLFTVAGTTTSFLSSQVKAALKNGSCAGATHWTFDGTYTPYSGTPVQLTAAAYGTNSVFISSYSNSGNGAFFMSSNHPIQNFVNVGGGGAFGQNDTFTITKMELWSNNNLVSSRDINQLLGYGDEFYIYHRLLVGQGNSTDYRSDNAVAEALAVGTCLPITGIQYTRSDTGSTTYAATNFAWGSYYEEYQATALSDFMSSGSPTHIIMVNQYNQPYATRSLSGTHTLGNRVKFKFDINASP